MSTSYSLEDNREKGLYLGSQIIWYILSGIEVFLLLRLLLKLLSANEAVWFTEIIYNVSGFLLIPFHALFRPSSPLTVKGSIFEWDILIAILVYWIIAIAIIQLFGLGRKVSTQEAHDDLEKNS